MYIRTKDGVYEVKREEILCGVKFYDVEDDDHLNRIREEQIIAQSENLTELCDVFVLIERNAKPIIFKTLLGAINNKIYDDETIYGCIWTFKGLIYVAKTNEKGELCLL